MRTGFPVGIGLMVAMFLHGCGGGSASGMGVQTETEAGTEGGGDSGGDGMMVMSGVELSSEDQETVGDFDEAIASWDARMQNDPSGCSFACEMKERVCDLSERICDIAERHPGDGRLGSRCTDGRDRCARAGETVERCGCE